MNIQDILRQYAKDKKNSELLQLLKQHKHIAINGLSESALSMRIASLYTNIEKPFLLIFNNKEEAAYYFNDFERLVGNKKVLFFPESYRRAYQIEETDNANVLLRSKVLSHLQSRQKPQIIVSYGAALFEQVVVKKELKSNTLKIKVGDKLSMDFLYDIMFEYQFEQVDFVTQAGEFSIRGGILDVYSFGDDEPYRIELFGDEIESIRTFDIETQISIDKLKQVQIIPNLSSKTLIQQRQSFLDYIKKDTIVLLKNRNATSTTLDALFEKANQQFDDLSSDLQHLNPSELFCNAHSFQQKLNNFILLEQHTSKNDIASISFQIQPQPAFNKSFELLIENLQQNTKNAKQNILFCTTEKQAERIDAIFKDMDVEVDYQSLVFPLYKGFIDNDLFLACYTDHQIFERYHRFSIRKNAQKRQAVTLKEITSLKEGDYVTHSDHGIGIFGGLQKIERAGKEQEVIEIIYKNGDRLFVSIHSLHKISKYNAKEGAVPKVSKLGSGAWKLLKQKTKKRLKELAFDIIKLYAERKLQKAYKYAHDSYLQHELEASFMYEDTPDQYKATQDIKADMESDKTMDRLVCGDVGFGKTEVALRAAFKAVDNGKQVAVLVPTTILAFQHFKTFSERLKDFPVVVDYLNRFRTAKQKRIILEDLQAGKIDIIVGTHALVSEKIKYKDLGLMIIDEEQKFGVSVKEKLKIIRKNIDTLTLTATPIPRTLQFSLINERDMSIINTAPPNRHPIETQVIRFDEKTIRDAVTYEIERKGQVFFIHNRIENIKEVAGMIQRLVPEARIGIGHGQMEGRKLERLMLDFINGEFDVLVSTTIIENGLDVPNANTIFINNANNFGLADLHQMRGRVGRSNKKAFCYFITPPYSAMTPEARKRIEAIETYTELGSGFQIAMKDLEIRGAGDLLGAEQSGFINDIGFDTYQKILKEAIQELETNEFKDYFKNEKAEKFTIETQVDTDFEILFPNEYINVTSERLKLYNELASINTEADLIKFENELVDRFGVLPKPTIDLLNAVRLKWLAQELGFEKLVVKKGKMLAYFISNQDSPYFQTNIFRQILQKVQDNQACCQFKEKRINNEERLYLVYQNVYSVNESISLLRKLK
jgi:transcription-repair coupling factor (superfamily II helicase)